MEFFVTSMTHLISILIGIIDALRIVTGCLRPTPADNLPTLAAIQPAELRRIVATLSLARRAMEPGQWTSAPLSAHPPIECKHARLKSRRPFVPAAQHLVSLFDNIRAAPWADCQWNAEWTDNPTRLRIFIPDTGTHPSGMTLPRRAWVRLNRLRTSVRRFRSCLYTWGMTSSASCECGAGEQTVDHAVLQCPLHLPPHGLHGLTVLDD